jgi:hypothetical protein
MEDITVVLTKTVLTQVVEVLEAGVAVEVQQVVLE